MSAGPKFPGLFKQTYENLSAGPRVEQARTIMKEFVTLFHNMLKTEHSNKAKDLDEMRGMFETIERNALNRKYTWLPLMIKEFLDYYGLTVYEMFDRNDAYLIEKFNDAKRIVFAPVAPTSKINTSIPVSVPAAGAGAGAGTGAGAGSASYASPEEELMVLAGAASKLHKSGIHPGSIFTLLNEEMSKRSPKGFTQLLKDLNLELSILRPAKGSESYDTIVKTMGLQIQQMALPGIDKTRILKEYSDNIENLYNKWLMKKGEIYRLDYYAVSGMIDKLLRGKTKLEKGLAPIKYAGGASRKRRNKRRMTRRRRV